MNTTRRTYIPFDSLWNMPIDLPYSFLVRSGDYAWSCGQLALDQDSQLLYPNDLQGQSMVVCDYIEEILSRGDLSAASVRRLVLYHTPSDAQAKQNMETCFQSRFGEQLVIDTVAVPWFYYDGIELEVDVFCGTRPATVLKQPLSGGGFTLVSDKQQTWASVATTSENISPDLMTFSEALKTHSPSASVCLSEHWSAPIDSMTTLSAWLKNNRPALDTGTIVDNQSENKTISGRILLMTTNDLSTQELVNSEVQITTRTAGDYCWLQARCTGQNLGLVDQTKSIMQTLESHLTKNGFSFEDVVKSTTHYTGGDSAQELHDNMQVRNRFYKSPGPASTGLPVFGFADPNSKIAVDILAQRNL